VFLTLSFKKEVEQRTASNNAIIGVDRGINVIACATDGKRTWMRRGGHTHHVRNRYLHTRSSLQKKKAEQSSRSKAKLLKLAVWLREAFYAGSKSGGLEVDYYVRP
jgi:transposase